MTTQSRKPKVDWTPLLRTLLDRHASWLEDLDVTDGGVLLDGAPPAGIAALFAGPQDAFPAVQRLSLYMLETSMFTIIPVTPAGADGAEIAAGLLLANLSTTAPNLKELSIQLHHDSPMPSVSRMFAGGRNMQFRNLEKLELRVMSLSLPQKTFDVAQLVQVMPNLKCFILEGYWELLPAYHLASPVLSVSAQADTITRLLIHMKELEELVIDVPFVDTPMGRVVGFHGVRHLLDSLGKTEAAGPKLKKLSFLGHLHFADEQEEDEEEEEFGMRAVVEQFFAQRKKSMGPAELEFKNGYPHRILAKSDGSWEFAADESGTRLTRDEAMDVGKCYCSGNFDDEDEDFGDDEEDHEFDDEQALYDYGYGFGYEEFDDGFDGEDFEDEEGEEGDYEDDEY